MNKKKAWEASLEANANKIDEFLPPVNRNLGYLFLCSCMGIGALYFFLTKTMFLVKLYDVIANKKGAYIYLIRIFWDSIIQNQMPIF